MKIHHLGFLSDRFPFSPPTSEPDKHFSLSIKIFLFPHHLEAVPGILNSVKGHSATYLCIVFPGRGYVAMPQDLRNIWKEGGVTIDYPPGKGWSEILHSEFHAAISCTSAFGFLKWLEL